MSKLITRAGNGFKEAEVLDWKIEEKENAAVIPNKRLQLVDIIFLKRHWPFHSSLEKIVNRALDFAGNQGYDYTFVENPEISIRYEEFGRDPSCWSNYRTTTDNYKLYMVKYYVDVEKRMDGNWEFIYPSSPD